ncbi:MAG: type I glyceraldehyde-3-phosphate dehydrogenase [Candidatus Woesearchaeota archaeon]
MRVAINGFGRIGRVVFKLALEKKVNIVAINDVHGPEDAAYLLKYDSTYGRFNGKIKSTKDSIIVNGKKILVLSERDPLKLPWKKLKVDVVVESTGAFTEKEGFLQHLEAGAKKVVITAPAKGQDITIVPGINHKKLKNKHKTISIASCTTNCLAPVLKVLNNKFKIKNALMTTAHAYTNSQGLLDGYHKKPRRGRSAAMNIVPTTTGASQAVIEAMPEMKGKIDGMAMRVPVAAGSIIDLTAELKKRFDVDKINKAFKEASQKELKGILNYTEEELVSSDIIGDSHSVVIDGLNTRKIGKLVKVLAWYDNEFGYSCRVVEVIKMLRKWT